MKLERRRLLVAGIATAAGTLLGASGLAQTKERVIRVTARKFVFLPREIRLKKGVAGGARVRHRRRRHGIQRAGLQRARRHHPGPGGARAPGAGQDRHLRVFVRYLLRRRPRGNVRADSRRRLTRDMMLLVTDPVPLHQYESAPPHETLSERKRRFEQSVLPHFDAAYNLARWLTRNDQDAQDVAQEAVLRAYRFFDGLRGEAKPWLLAIVRNSCLTWLAANWPAETVGFEDGAVELLPSDEDGPEVQAARNFDRRMLNDAIAGLPAQFREVLILRELEDLSYKSIARIVDVPIGTVMSRLARARRLLAESVRAASSISATQVPK